MKKVANINRETLMKALAKNEPSVMDAFHVAMKRSCKLAEKQMVKESIQMYGCQTFYEVEMSDCIDESIYFNTRKAVRAIIYLNTCIRKLTGEVMLNVFLREDDYRSEDIIDEFLSMTSVTSYQHTKVA